MLTKEQLDSRMQQLAEVVNTAREKLLVSTLERAGVDLKSASDVKRHLQTHRIEWFVVDPPDPYLYRVLLRVNAVAVGEVYTEIVDQRFKVSYRTL